MLPYVIRVNAKPRAHLEIEFAILLALILARLIQSMSMVEKAKISTRRTLSTMSRLLGRIRACTTKPILTMPL